MTDSTAVARVRTHPAPHRHKVSLFALFFGIVAAPAAWNAQILFSTALSGHACYPRDALLAAPVWSSLWRILLAISLIAIVISVASGATALRSWLRTRDELAGSGHHLVDTGEGRTRFLAMFGMLTSLLFLIATLFATSVIFLVPLCT